MKLLMKKEWKLTVTPVPLLFLLLSALVLVPSYPYYVTFFYNALGIFLMLSIQWFFCYVLYGYEYQGYAYVRHYLPRMAYSLAFMPLTYYFNRALALFIRERE